VHGSVVIILLLIAPDNLISKFIFHRGRNNKAYCEKQTQKMHEIFLGVTLARIIKI
jgi:hypothetical protein